MSELENVYIADDVRSVQQLHADLLGENSADLSIRDRLNQQAERIAAAHAECNRAVVFHIACWHPTLVSTPADDIMSAEFGLSDARETMAREYGFSDWSQVETTEESPDLAFESAVDTLLSGDVAGLRSLLEQHPHLVHDRSRFGHRATLLHYVGSNGVETYRQVVPRNLAEVARVLIEFGADVNATAEMYGGGSTTLGLLTSSAHPAAAGVTDEVASVLLEAGAKS